MNGLAGDLPYSFLHHLREALMTLKPGTKDSKLVHRVHSLEFPYRMVKGGFTWAAAPTWRSTRCPRTPICGAITRVGGDRPICERLIASRSLSAVRLFGRR